MIDALLNSEVGDMGGSGLISVVIRLSEIMNQYRFKNLSFSIPSFIDYSILSESPNDLLDFQTVIPMPIMNNVRNKKDTQNKNYQSPRRENNNNSNSERNKNTERNKNKTKTR